MPAILQPFDIAREILGDTGEFDERELSVKEKATRALSRHGAGIEDVAIAIAEGLQDESQRMTASKLALEVHGVITKDLRVVVPSINIVINGSNQTLLQLISPRIQ